MKAGITLSVLSLLLLALAGCDGAPETSGHAGHEDEKTSPHQEEGGNEHAGHGEEEPRHVKLTAEQLGLLDLRTAVARPGRADDIIQVPAATHFNQDRISHVGPLLAGRVTRVVADLGQQVEAGDPLAVLASPQLGDARARFLRLRAERQAARADWQRQQRLAKQDIASEAERLDARARYRATAAELDAARAGLRAMGMDDPAIEALEASDDLSRYVLTSPQAGVLEKRDLAPGQMLDASDTPLLVADTESLWIFGEVYEKHAGAVAPGQAVRFSTGENGPELEGRIDWVANHLDEKTRTLRVRAVVDNKAGVRAGQYGQLKILRRPDSPRPMIPVDAVQTIDGEPHVFVPGEEKGKYLARAVRPGDEGHGLVEIVAGLDAGTTVVAGGAFDLKSALTAGGRSAAHHH